MPKRKEFYDGMYQIKRANGKLRTGAGRNDFSTPVEAEYWAWRVCQKNLMPGELGIIHVVKYPGPVQIVKREIRYASSEH